MALPYFNLLLEGFRRGDRDLEQAFGRHVHWGYWIDPDSADGSLGDFGRASEALNQLIISKAGVEDGTAVLDVGCGFGGTIASLNERFEGMELMGLNLEERQLQRARSQVGPSERNRIEFIQGDACALPFAEQRFDVVLAVECVFHFPRRATFLQEVRRVLKPGGRLVLSDFLLPETESLTAQIERGLFGWLLGLLFGPLEIVRFSDYEELARASGFQPPAAIDITRRSMPTYDVLEKLLAAKGPKALLPTLLLRSMAKAQQRRRFLYEVLSFKLGEVPDRVSTGGGF